MKRKAGFFFSILLAGMVYGQQAGETLELGGVRYYVGNAGVLFQQNGASAFEVPKNSGIYSIISSGLWVGGLDSSGGIRLAAGCYDTSGRDFQPGPLDLGTVQADDTSYWNYTWHVDSAEVENHKSAFNNSGYQAPWSIKNWPGSNPRPGNFSPVLAPFVDLNNDQVYQPDSGEIPYFKGTEAAYVIFNDKRATHQQSGAEALGIEVYGMIFSVPQLPNVVFVQYRIINRSYSSFDSVYAGIFTDFKLGNEEDNYISTDVSRNTYFAYNALPYDSNGYLDKPPVMGVKFLNATLDHSISFNHDPNDPKGWPQTPEEYYGYMKTKWRDGTAIMDPTSSQTTHLFAGDPCNGSGWTEYGGSGAIPGRRNMLGTTGPIALKHGEVIKLDVAYIFTQKQGDVLANVCDFYSDADEVQAYWQNFISSSKPVPSTNKLTVYPNPTSGVLRWNLQDDVQVKEIQLINLQGQQIKINPAAKEMDTRDLPNGIYLLRIQDSDGNMYSRKVVLE